MTKKLKAYHKQLVKLDETRKRMESLYQSGHVILRDVHSVYESLFLRAVVGFEHFCEKLFFAIVEGKITYPSTRLRCLLTGARADEVLGIVLQRDNYLTWLPYKNAEERAKLFMFAKGPKKANGRPFLDLTTGEKSQLATICTIRNAIAHISDYSIEKFTKTVIGNQSIPPSERKPASFLRSQIAGSPPATRFEIYISNLGSIAQNIEGVPEGEQ